MAVLAVAFVLAVPATGAAATGGASTRVIVRQQAGTGSAAERLVRDLGGTVIRRIGIIDAFTADVPARAIGRLAASSTVASVTPDARVQMLGMMDGVDASADLGSPYNTRELIGAGEFWKAGFTGKGVDVALIDSGVTPVKGLAGRGKVLNGPDLSFESQRAATRYLDTYGHGTHMAGIIGGRDPGSYPISASDSSHFLGIAPDSRIISLKVADARGGTDVSQVIAAIDWVVQHRHTDGLNIRVLNLSFGTDSQQSYLTDPLAYAVEVAWKSGIFVVAAAGNQGFRGAVGHGASDAWVTDDGGDGGDDDGDDGIADDMLNDPAFDPLVLAVGASDTMGTATTSDDRVATFSSHGNSTRRPDLLTPGRSVISLRVPGSFIDNSFPLGRVADRFFRGSGTSQAAAVASGAAALVIQQRPSITPDQLKALFRRTATKLAHTDRSAQGRGLMDLATALGTRTKNKVQEPTGATGRGSLELSRGSLHLVRDEVVLSGEVDIFGHRFSSRAWARRAAAHTTWSGGAWMDSSWTGSSWSGSSWTGSSWTGSSWTGVSWKDASWTAGDWTGSSWTGSSWTGGRWTGSSWSMASSSLGAWAGSSWGK
jgi:serine protease AprX